MLSPRRWEPNLTLRLLAILPLLMIGSGMILEAVLRLFGDPQSEARPPWLLALGTGLFHIATLYLMGHLLRAHEVGWRSAFGFLEGGWLRKWALAIALTIPAMFTAWLVHRGCIGLLDYFSIPYDFQSAVEAIRQSPGIWERATLFVFAVITAPIVEECLFRGILWPLARDRGWKISGCIGAALVFSLIHMNIAALIPLWLLGIFWTWLYERTRDLSAPILSHAVFNGVNFLWLVLAESGSVQ